MSGGGPSRKLLRVVDTLFNADLPLRRNRLNTDLQPVIELIFKDIADQAQIEILQSCYVHTGSLKIVQNDLDHIITQSIPQFLVAEGTKAVGEQDAQAGFEQTVSRTLGTNTGMLFLLLGGIGCGKTTFLKRYQRTTGGETLRQQSLWFAVDFLQAPIDPTALEDFVWRSVLDDMRHKYKEQSYERLKNLREVFADDIRVLESSVLVGVRQRSSRYDELLGPYLARWQENLVNYVPKLLAHSCKIDKRKPVLFIDNVDQLPPAYQAQIFLLAQRVTRMLESITLISLREESYYTASIQKNFTAYNSQKCHIASPRFRAMITSRIKYAVRLLRDRSTAEAGAADYAAISDFLLIMQDSIFGTNHNIIRFIEAICYGNMRFALQLFEMFLTSGATDVDKMLRIYRRDGKYNVAFHEFVKSVMLGDRRYYKEDQSAVMNLFNVGSEKNSSHFTAYRIIVALGARRGESCPEGRGYVALSDVISCFENTFNNRGDLVASMNRLVKQQLIETNNRSSECIDGASHVRVTSAGLYYVHYLSRSFAYLDLILQDTPINDEGVEKALRESVFQVDNLSDREDVKLERMAKRFERVERFLAYLKKEEDRERLEYSLTEAEGALGAVIVPAIQEQFAKERAWIERRVRENREKYEDDSPQGDGTDTFGPDDSEEEAETAG